MFNYVLFETERRKRGSGGFNLFEQIAAATGGKIVHTSSSSLGGILGEFVKVRLNMWWTHLCVSGSSSSSSSSSRSSSNGCCSSSSSTCSSNNSSNSSSKSSSGSMEKVYLIIWKVDFVAF